MTPSQLKHREVLLARQDVALERWPDGNSPQFRREVADVAQSLERLACAADAAGGHRLERSRTWRYVGNAYSDVAFDQDVSQLEPAADAYRRAEALLEGLDEPIERMKLDFSMARALVRLAQGTDLALAREARDRFASALRLARTHMPAGVADVARALADAEEALALVQTISHVDERIGELKEELKGDDRPAATSTWPTEFQGLFEQLQNVYQQDIQAGKVSPVRQQALDPVLQQLGNMLEYRPDDLGGKLSQRSELHELMARMAPLLGKTGQQPSSAPSGSSSGRAQAVWRRFAAIKISLARAMALQQGGSETQFCAMELYQRCGHADTFVHQHADDDGWIYDYERDVLRQLAMDVRDYSLRNHLTLAQPIWPSLPLAQDPSGVFFSGGATVGRLIAGACRRSGLTLLTADAAKDYAVARWDQLRGSHVAVFDYTGYHVPDVDRPADLTAANPTAAVSYELGIALALGRPVIVVAQEGQALPFDVDVVPFRLQGDGHDEERATEALDDTIYGLQRGGSGNSLAATREYLKRCYASAAHVVIAQSLKLIDESLERDPVKFRRFVLPLLGGAGADAPQMILPAWPGSYPGTMEQHLFHVTPFGPVWAGDTMQVATQACAATAPPVQYIRGDQVMDPYIILSIWDNLCQATHVLVDLTGLNANVLLELGIAHTLGRNVLLVSQDEPGKDALPSLSKQRVHRYNVGSPQGLRPLRMALDAFFVRG